MTLTPAEIEQFVEQGFVRVDGAFPRKLADVGRGLLWEKLGCDPDDRSTWTQPVMRLPLYQDPPFAAAINTPRLHGALDQLTGPGRWMPRDGLGYWVVRFPSPEEPGDTGWHIDASFPPASGDQLDFGKWRVNYKSRGRLLLMLFLLSDVGEDDAPTRIAVGSHFATARALLPYGEDGHGLMKLGLGGVFEGPTKGCEVALATGEAGTVYLCHPFLVHAAQTLKSDRPRFLAQPGLEPAEEISLDRPDGDYSPVERAIRIGLGL
jgi:hypothetical protein